MKLYKRAAEIWIEHDEKWYQPRDMGWDELVNRKNLYPFLVEQLPIFTHAGQPDLNQVLDPPMGAQEIWAAGVTYFRSREARMEESKVSGGGSFYDRVYTAERPEIFFKAIARRTSGNRQQVLIRRDSNWNVPEPELTLFISSEATIEGYTIGNDMSSRSIEGENPLYLPQAKCYEKSAALGPCLYVPARSLPPDTPIRLQILRNKEAIFQGHVMISQMKRKPDELVSYLYRECDFPNGCYLMTGTGVIPPDNLTLEVGDEVRITIDPVGTLVNFVNMKS